KFWGGLTVEAWGGGPGLVDALTRVARTNGVAIAYGARALSLIADDDGVKGVRVKHNGKTVEVRAKGIVFAAGGFQANTEVRTRYLGPLVGAGQGARHAFQYRRRYQNGDRGWRNADGQLVGGPCSRLGPQRAGIRRSIGRRQFSEAFLSARDHDQRQRRAFRR